MSSKVNAIQRMNYENTLLFIARSSYVSASTLTLAETDSTDLAQLKVVHNRVKKRLCTALNQSHIAGYSKKNGLKVYGLTLKGASYLKGLGHEVCTTYKQAYDAQHVYHRLCADAFCLALRLFYAKASADAGLKVSERLERDCLRQADTFKMHFQKVPDSCFQIEKSMCWIEVDTARKKATDMNRLIKFIKFGMCLDESSLAVHDIANPEVLLWVCAPAAVRDAANRIQQSLPLKNGFQQLSKGVWKVTIDSGSIERDVILCSFDFKSVSDLHTRIFKHYTPALTACCPVQL